MKNILKWCNKQTKEMIGQNDKVGSLRADWFVTGF